MPNIYLDIETFGGEKPTKEDLFKGLKPAAACKTDKSRAENIEKQKKAIEDDLENCIDKAWRKQALDFFKAQIICIGYKVDGNKTYSIAGDDEKRIMKTLDRACARARSKGVIKWFSFNGSKFDLAIIGLRAMKYNCKHVLATLPKTERDKNNFDLMSRFTPTVWGSMYSLANICKFLGIEVKTGDITGATVHDHYLEGNIDGIAAYCREDVIVLPKLATKMGFSEVNLDDLKLNVPKT
ncbi:MAG: ribonuclease H-like domain-containing protein [Bacteroidales bacterium]